VLLGKNFAQAGDAGAQLSNVDSFHGGTILVYVTRGPRAKERAQTPCFKLA
jgi:hypothetical protein